jgi:electron transfer flavoprotein alpha subunit
VEIAVLVKQVPAADALSLDPEGRLRRVGLPAEMNPFCRRAVAKGVELAAATGGRCTAITMGPPAAEDSVREAVAGGADRGILLSDPALAGADSLATAAALAALLRQRGPFDLVLLGRSSVDAETGQLGPELAELLDLPFVAAARVIDVDGSTLRILGERDDGSRLVEVGLPAVVSAAERLTDPCKRTPEERQAVPADRIVRITASELGAGPWGAAASPTSVGAVRSVAVDRARRILQGTPEEQVAAALDALEARGVQLPTVSPRQPVQAAAGPAPEVPGRDVVEAVPARTGPPAGPVVAVVCESADETVLRPLVGEAAVVARAVRGQVSVVCPGPADPGLGAYGADTVVSVTGTRVEEDLAATLAEHWADQRPWAVLVPATVWGREVAGRLAARLGAGLIGDAVGVGVVDGRLVGLKPALGGQLVVEVRAAGTPQLVTVRPGILPGRQPRAGTEAAVETLVGQSRSRVRVLETFRDDDVGLLAGAPVVVCAGLGVDQAGLPLVEALAEAAGGVVGATRKLTDRGWLPRSRQIGITGQSVAPSLLVLVGVSGALNHMIATQAAGTIVAINSDPAAKVFAWADIGLVADWRQVVPLLTEAWAWADRSSAMASSGSSASISDLGTPSR